MAIEERVWGRTKNRHVVPLNLAWLPDFERQVLIKTLEIPRGEVRPYSWIAAELGRPLAVRAVGNALARNPVPFVVPCHRVVRSDGRIGNYGAGGPRSQARAAGGGGPRHGRTGRAAGARSAISGVRHDGHLLLPVMQERAADNAAYIGCRCARPTRRSERAIGRARFAGRWPRHSGWPWPDAERRHPVAGRRRIRPPDRWPAWSMLAVHVLRPQRTGPQVFTPDIRAVPADPALSPAPPSWRSSPGGACRPSCCWRSSSRSRCAMDRCSSRSPRPRQPVRNDCTSCPGTWRLAASPSKRWLTPSRMRTQTSSAWSSWSRASRERRESDARLQELYPYQVLLPRSGCARPWPAQPFPDHRAGVHRRAKPAARRHSATRWLAHNRLCRSPVPGVHRPDRLRAGHPDSQPRRGNQRHPRPD